jgi:exopolysaccharide production protein ExoZ
MAVQAVANPSSRRSVLNIQALRAVAALMVVFTHIGGANGLEDKAFGPSKPWWGNLAAVGSTGVNLFFVISGFIMVMVTTRTTHGVAGAGEFLRRRITRVYPPYLVITLVIYVIYQVSPSFVNSSATVRPSVVASFLLLPQAGLPLLLVGWTLVFEMYFYLVFTLGLLAPRRAFPYLLAGWGIVTALLHFVHGNNVWLGLVASPLNFEFLFGAIIGWLVISDRVRAPRSIGSLGLIATGVFYVLVMFNHHGFADNSWLTVFTTGVALALVIYGCVGIEFNDGRVLPLRLVALGGASYAIYLTHIAVLKVFGIVLSHLHLHQNLILQLIVAVAAFGVAIVGGIVYYVVVEKPLLKVLHDRKSIFRRPNRQAVAPTEPAPVPVAQP